MTGAFLGFTFLLAELFPVGSVLTAIAADKVYGKPFGMDPPSLYYLLLWVAAYLPAAAVTAWFFRSSRLASRVPLQVPGSRMLLGGSLLEVFSFVAGLLILEGGGARGVITRLPLFLLWAARALLAIGAVKLLLSASPEVTWTQSPEAQQNV